MKRNEREEMNRSVQTFHYVLFCSIFFPLIQYTVHRTPHRNIAEAIESAFYFIMNFLKILPRKCERQRRVFMRVVGVCARASNVYLALGARCTRSTVRPYAQIKFTTPFECKRILFAREGSEK